MEETAYPDFIMEFSNYLIGIKNFSQVYVTNMMITIKQFLSFINIHKYNNKYNSIKKMSLNDLRGLTNSDIYSFIYFLAENHYQCSSRIKKTEHLRSFFDFLYRIKHTLFKEPFKEIKREKNIYSKLPEYLSFNEAQKVQALYKNSTDEKEIRDNAIVHLFLHCGLRVSEVSNLNINDINFNNDTFLIYGKGRKERVGYLNKPTKDALLSYLEIRKKLQAKNKKDDNAVFLTQKRTRISARHIRTSIKMMYEKAEIHNENYSVHTLRHTCATLLYKNGADLKIIMLILRSFSN